LARGSSRTETPTSARSTAPWRVCGVRLLFH
jgi:hypothetical protein